MATKKVTAVVGSDPNENVSALSSGISALAYEPTTWNTGDIITSTKLNKAEQGIADAYDLAESASDSLETVSSSVETLDAMFENENAGKHNSIFRGKYLGTAVTAEQANAISNATFDDLYIGDYWTIGGVNYRIGCFDYYYRCGNISLTKHHAVLVPDTNLYTAPMNATNTTTGAYVSSAMYTGEAITVSDVEYTGLTKARETIAEAFGDYLIAHDIYLQNATTDGYPSAGAWVSDCTVELMTEHMVYGGPVYQIMRSGSLEAVNLYRIEKSQLPLFALSPQYINIRSAYWLRDVASATAFCNVYNNGYANAYNASYVSGVRPAFCIS